MPTVALTIEQMQEAVDAVALHGSQNEAARQLGLNRATFLHRYRQGVKKGLDEAIVHPAPQGHQVKGVSSFYGYSDFSVETACRHGIVLFGLSC